MSSGTPRRGASVCVSISAAIGGGTFLRPPSLWISPGQIALQRRPCLPYCAATVRTMLMMAALDAAYEMLARSPSRPEPEEVITIAPPPDFRMCGIAYLQPAR